MLLIIFISSILTSCAGVNYCHSKMCGYTNAHTFCQFAGDRSKQCIGYIPAQLSEAEKAHILERMNRRRNDVASGKQRGWPSALNMMKLRWVPELASEAQLWADQCRKPKTPEEHDACHSVSVGQCVATVVGEAPGLKVASMVDMWYMQGLLYKGNVTVYEPPPSSKRYYGDFAQLLWSNSYMVGCGRSRFMLAMGGRLKPIERLVCNIAPHGPPPARPLWSVGAPAGNCPDMAVPDQHFKALCDYQYRNDTGVNNFTVERILLNTVLELERNDDKASIDDKYFENMPTHLMKDKIGVMDSKHKKNTEIDAIGKDSNETDRDNVVVNRKAYYKQLNLVGRPKLYNVEELSGISGDFKKSKTLNEIEKDDYTNEVLMKSPVADLDDIEEHKRKAMFDVDDEYNAIDNDDNENINIRTKHTEILKTTSLYDTIVNITSTTETMILINEVTTEGMKVNLNMTFGNNESAAARDFVDLNDPETVRELQAALEHMEREGEIRGQIIPGKVRRDLRDATNLKQSKHNLEEKSLDEKRLEKKKLEKQNDTDKSPMMNMVLKYMPYLKKYEHELLGTTSSYAPPKNTDFFVRCFGVSFCLLFLSVL